VQLNPDDASLRMSYGWHLRRNGQLREAAEQLTAAVELNPMNGLYRHELAGTLQDAQRYTEAVGVLRDGLDPSGRDPTLLDELARLLATCPEERYRNPEEAVRLAREACDKTREQPVADMLETLGLAYEAAGQREEAIAALGVAMDAGQKAGKERLVQRCRDKLERMRQPAR